MHPSCILRLGSAAPQRGGERSALSRRIATSGSPGLPLLGRCTAQVARLPLLLSASGIPFGRPIWAASDLGVLLRHLTWEASGYHRECIFAGQLKPKLLGPSPHLTSCGTVPQRKCQRQKPSACDSVFRPTESELGYEGARMWFSAVWS